MVRALIPCRIMLLLPLLIGAACAADHQPAKREQASVAEAPITGREGALTAAELQAFVQEFYDWYAYQANQVHQGSAWDAVLRQKPSLLAPRLLQALTDDAASRALAVGEIVGLDFDPFLSAQDPCERYEVRETTQSGANYRVGVHGICSGQAMRDPAVVAEVARSDGGWVFVNFHYPGERSDLLGVLGLLARQRY